jgi:hypothetical protein
LVWVGVVRFLRYAGSWAPAVKGMMLLMVLFSGLGLVV